MHCKNFRIFSTKDISTFGYKFEKHLTSWPLNELVKLAMLWATGPSMLSTTLSPFFGSMGYLYLLALKSA